MRFRMVDRIIEWEPGKRIRGLKTVSFEEYGMREAFGAEEALPETLVMESLFQLGNWLIVLSSDFTSMGIIIRTGRIAFEDLLRPGEVMSVEVHVRSWREDGILFEGRGRSGDRTIASGEGCLAVPVPLDRYHDPADLRILFEEIHRPTGPGGAP
jgi:3-hydroxyacyl-[acyl-carrier-protein] dehydratase